MPILGQRAIPTRRGRAHQRGCQRPGRDAARCHGARRLGGRFLRARIRRPDEVIHRGICRLMAVGLCRCSEIKLVTYHGD